ncbi:MAG: DUF411 domain-containing protein [Dichotomicrobium sp.]
MNLVRATMVVLVAAMAGIHPEAAADQSMRSQSLPVVEMTKHPNCGCCTKWADHMREAGFKVEVTETERMWGVKRMAGVPKDLDSCHTAKIGGYIVEGHVPAEDVKRLLRSSPDVRGLSVPGMPIGSPGMEVGDQTEPYDVLTFDAEGETTVFQSYR